MGERLKREGIYVDFFQESCMESGTMKKAEHQRTDAFERWSWQRLLRVLWIERRSNQSILKEINPEYYCKV